jgi:hypothetical protein
MTPEELVQIIFDQNTQQLQAVIASSPVKHLDEKTGF